MQALYIFMTPTDVPMQIHESMNLRVSSIITVDVGKARSETEIYIVFFFPLSIQRLMCRRDVSGNISDTRRPIPKTLKPWCTDCTNIETLDRCSSDLLKGQNFRSLKANSLFGKDMFRLKLFSNFFFFFFFAGIVSAPYLNQLMSTCYHKSYWKPTVPYLKLMYFTTFLKKLMILFYRNTTFWMMINFCNSCLLRPGYCPFF